MRCARSAAQLLCVALLCLACTPAGAPSGGPSSSPTGPVVTSKRGGITVERATVVAHTDGDTLDVRRSNGVVTPVRFIGIDTPEVDDDGFAAASAFTAKRAPIGSTVFLEFDREERDRFGRLLAYVWLKEPRARTLGHVRQRMLNGMLVARGWATFLTIPPNVRYSGTFTVLQEAARVAGAGLWTGGLCDPSYPGICVPPPPPDLDCVHIVDREFQVRGPDPHGFDSDGNGRGCEAV